MAKEVTCRIRENPQWKENKNVCCYFCGSTKGVEYLVDLPNVNGERVLTVDACGCCVMLMNGGKMSNCKECLSEEVCRYNESKNDKRTI